MDVYEKCPVYQNEQYMMRLVGMDDAPGLLKVYSDPVAKPLFNSDNCSGGFSFDTLERMREVIAAWRMAYERRDFVRWSVMDRKIGEAIGTIEMFHCDSDDAFTNAGMMRLDLRSDYENEKAILSIAALIVEPAYELFYCDSIITKAVAWAAERRKALHSMGFMQSDEQLIGHDGTAYGCYFERRKDA